MNTNCRHITSDGICKKWHNSRPCKPSTKDWCDEPVATIDPSEMCQNSSIFGNTFSYITPEQLVDLTNGKIIEVDDGEYAHFICLKK